MSDDFEIRTLKEPTPTPLPRSTRRKVALAIFGLLLTCAVGSYYVYLLIQISIMQNTRPEVFYLYATSTPDSAQISADPGPIQQIKFLGVSDNSLYVTVHYEEMLSLWEADMNVQLPAEEVVEFVHNRDLDFQVVPYHDGFKRNSDIFFTAINIHTQKSQTYHLDSSIYEAVDPAHLWAVYSPRLPEFDIEYQENASDSGRLISIHRPTGHEQELLTQRLDWSPTTTAVIGQELLFKSADNTLWLTDGSPDNTRPVLTDSNHTASPSNFRPLPWAESVLFVTTQPETQQRNLWITNGQITATHSLITDTSSLSLAQLEDGQPAVWPTIAVDPTIYFLTTSTPETAGTWDGRLWVTNGTPESTRILHNFAETSTFSPTQIPDIEMTVTGTLYLLVETQQGVPRIWRSDGRAENIYVVLDQDPYEQPLQPAHLTAIGDHLFFTTVNDDGHALLWSLDQRTNELILYETALYKWQNLEILAAVDDHLYFTAETAERGPLLWALNHKTNQATLFELDRLGSFQDRIFSPRTFSITPQKEFVSPFRKVASSPSWSTLTLQQMGSLLQNPALTADH